MKKSEKIDVEVAWDMFCEMNPGLKGYEKTKAQHIFFKAYGIFVAIEDAKSKTIGKKLQFWK